MKKKSTAKPKAKTTTKRKASASAKAFGKKAKRTNELAFTKAYLDGKSGKRIRTPKAYLKEAAARVWK